MQKRNHAIGEVCWLSKEPADGRNYCRSLLQFLNCWKEAVSGLGSFLYITLWESFHQQKRASGDLLLRSEKWLFSPKRGWWRIMFFGIILFSYSSSLYCNTFKKNYIRKKVTGKNVIIDITRGHKIVSSGSRVHPRNICNQCLFMVCAGLMFNVFKQTLNYAFSTIQYTCFVISSIMSKLCLFFRPYVAWTDGTNLSLIDKVAIIKWVTWENYISQTSLVTYVFYSTFQVTIMWTTIEKSLKKILRQLLLLRNHLKMIIWYF